MMDFNFAKATISQKLFIHNWLEQEHIKKWLHGIGLQNTLADLEQFFLGNSIATYWIGYDKEVPFAFFITTEEEDTITLDIFIGELSYLGKGFAVKLIKKFLLTKFHNVKKVLIDPEVTNTRAVHVYKKVGFRIVKEFIASWHPVPHYQMELNMNELLKNEV